MADGVKGGVVTVLEQLRPHEQGPVEVAEQPDLLPDLLGMRVAAVGDAPRGPGRPPGARNRRTAEWAGYLLSRYASPLEVLAQLATARVEDLALQLGCTGLEALQEKRHAAVALLPFLHQRMPIAVDVTNHKVVNLTIVDLLRMTRLTAWLPRSSEWCKIKGLAMVVMNQSDSVQSDSCTNMLMLLSNACVEQLIINQPASPSSTQCRGLDRRWTILPPIVRREGGTPVSGARPPRNVYARVLYRLGWNFGANNALTALGRGEPEDERR